MFLKSESESHSVMSNSLWAHGLYSPWNSPGQSTGVGRFPSSGDLPTQGLNPGLLHCRHILYRLSHKWSLLSLSLNIFQKWSGYVCQNYSKIHSYLALIALLLVEMKTILQCLYLLMFLACRRGLFLSRSSNLEYSSI